MTRSEVEAKQMNDRALFKKCPNCGKRFEVRHVAEKVEKKQEVIPEQKTLLMPSGIGVAYPLPPPTESSVPKINVEEAMEEDDYAETYTCTHCGYQWTETSEKTKDLGETKAP
jgi:predicted RNA-binding Zn-ribbon protein involved in translation (DUF1610 family)